jgi:hypothetical protein
MPPWVWVKEVLSKADCPPAPAGSQGAPIAGDVPQ